MSTPGRPTSEIQTEQGQAPEPGWETPIIRVGRKGLDIVRPITDVDPEALSRMHNVVSKQRGVLRTRPGQAEVGTDCGTRVHSLYRLNDPAATSYARLVGGDTNLYRGTTGAFTLIDSNYSGDPLTMVGANMPLSGTPFVFIGDRLRNRKVDRTGSVVIIGLPPATLSGASLVAQKVKSICEFDAGDSSAAANWTMTAGQDRLGNATGAPVASDIMGAGDLLVSVVTSPAGAAAGEGYDSIISIARTLNLDQFANAGEPAEDEDLIHLRINVSDPLFLEELKIYFVCSTFTAGAIPGASANNTNAYFKAIRPNDFAQLHGRVVSTTTAQGTARDTGLLNQFADDNSVIDPRNPSTTSALVESSRTVVPQFPAGRNVWGEFGILGIPLRRGDFTRVGNPETSAPGWSTITGIVIVIQTNTDSPITITFSDWTMDGGSGPDTADPGDKAMDYRVRHYNTVTGAKGNPSAVQAETAWLNPLRQSVSITGAASGLTNVVQQAFRRGGGPATSGDWYFCGQSSTDGGTITDTQEDDEVITEEVLEIDNDQPVTSVNASGTTVLNQIVPIFFAVEDYMFALGDPLQPQRLYRSKLRYPESWPANDYQDVCAATEELMCGGAYASSGFVFSRNRLYTILLNSLDGTWTSDPTGCAEGCVSRWGMCVTPFGIAFVSPFGIRITDGNSMDSLSEQQIGTIFRGSSINGYNAIDLSVPTAIGLTYHDFELWFTYQDCGGTRRQLIYNFFDKTWRTYLFDSRICVTYSEPMQGGVGRLLLGGNATGKVYSHSGLDDDGELIEYSFRTGSVDLGDPRREKLLSAVILDGDLKTSEVTLQTFLNSEDTTNTAQVVTGVAGQRRYNFEPFGTTPQHARNVAIEVRGEAPNDAFLQFNQLGVTFQPNPPITMNEPTPWEELPGGEGYLWGMFITCDTGGVARTVVVEGTTNNGSVTTLATLTVTGTGRRKLPFTWSSTLVQQVRLRPTGSGVSWMLFKVEWFTDPEPPRVYGWDTNWENFGSFSDKWIKGILIEADTFNAAKTVVLDIDQSLGAVAVGSLTFNGRTVQQIAFSKQRGRLFRLRSTDTTNYGKLYRWQPIFDEEPLALTRWETQERPFLGMEGRWQKPLDAYVTLRSSGTVTWQVTTTGTTYNSGTVALNTSSYTIASTGGAKLKIRVPLNAVKGLLFAHLFTASAQFWLYREESEILVEDFETGQAKWLPLFPSNDDLDPARTMGNAAVAAATPGGA